MIKIILRLKWMWGVGVGMPLGWWCHIWWHADSLPVLPFTGPWSWPCASEASPDERPLGVSAVLVLDLRFHFTFLTYERGDCCYSCQREGHRGSGKCFPKVRNPCSLSLSPGLCGCLQKVLYQPQSHFLHNQKVMTHSRVENAFPRFWWGGPAPG